MKDSFSAHPIFSRVLLICLGLLLAASAGEGLVRLMGTAPQVLVLSTEVTSENSLMGSFKLSENPILVYESVPLTGEINSLGFRGPIPKSKKLDYERIVFAGDSQAFGVRVPYKKTFTHLLEEKLHERGSKIEVYNIAVPGYDFVQEVERLRSMTPVLIPNKVVFALCENDFRVVSGELRTFASLLFKKKGIPNNEIQRISTRPVFGALLKSDLFKTLYFGSLFNSPEELGNLMGNLPSVERVTTSLKVLKAISDKYHFSYSFILLPTPDLNAWNPFYATGGMHLIFEKYGEKIWNLHQFVHKQYKMNQESVENLFLKNDPWHFNEKGHEIMSQFLASNQRLWLPKKYNRAH